MDWLKNLSKRARQGGKTNVAQLALEEQIERRVQMLNDPDMLWRKQMIDLTTLRDLASELGLELFYREGRSKTRYGKVTRSNFSQRRHIGLLKDGEIFLEPIDVKQLSSKMAHSVNRIKKAAHIKKTQKEYGFDPE